MDLLGWGPQSTPSRVVLTRPGVTLKAYSPPVEQEAGEITDSQQGRRPVLLIVPAPIKRAYLWDLAPEISVIRRCLDAGIRVYLIQWERPGIEEEEFGLDHYADRLILECLEAIEAETGRTRVVLAGHSLGGTLAAIFASLHPSRVQGLVLLEAPLRFGRSSGAFTPVVAAAFRAEAMTRPLGNVPGSLLSAMSLVNDPLTFGVARWMDWLESWPDPAAMRSHLRVTRWTLDEVPMPRRLFADIVEQLYREDRFARGELEVNGRPARLDNLEAPVLGVADPYSRVVPPRSTVVFNRAGRAESRILWYEGDVGVALQHAGPLVGRRAHHVLWPEIIRWIQDRENGTGRN